MIGEAKKACSSEDSGRRAIWRSPRIACRLGDATNDAVSIFQQLPDGLVCCGEPHSPRRQPLRQFSSGENDMANQVGDRYHRSNPDCGCEMEVKSPSRMAANGGSGSGMSSGSESHATSSRGRTPEGGSSSAGASTSGDYGSQGATGEGTFGTAGGGSESGTRQGRYGSDIRSSHSSESPSRSSSAGEDSSHYGSGVAWLRIRPGPVAIRPDLLLQGAHGGQERFLACGSEVVAVGFRCALTFPAQASRGGSSRRR